MGNAGGSARPRRGAGGARGGGEGGGGGGEEEKRPEAARPPPPRPFKRAASEGSLRRAGTDTGALTRSAVVTGRKQPAGPGAARAPPARRVREFEDVLPMLLSTRRAAGGEHQRAPMSRLAVLFDVAAVDDLHEHHRQRLVHKSLQSRYAAAGPARSLKRRVKPLQTSRSVDHIALLPGTPQRAAPPRPLPGSPAPADDDNHDDNDDDDADASSSEDTDAGAPAPAPVRMTRTHSILKRPPEAETWAEAVARVFQERLAAERRYRRVLSRGARLRTYDEQGAASDSLVLLSESGEEIAWGAWAAGEADGGAARARRELDEPPAAGRRGVGRWARRVFGRGSALAHRRDLADVESIAYGPDATRRLSPFVRRGGRPWLCFSVKFADGEVLPVSCASIDEVSNWVLGIQALIPLGHEYMTVGAFLWKRARMRLIHLARQKKGFVPELAREILRDAIVQVRTGHGAVPLMTQNGSPVPSPAPVALASSPADFRRSSRALGAGGGGGGGGGSGGSNSGSDDD